MNHANHVSCNYKLKVSDVFEAFPWWFAVSFNQNIETATEGGAIKAFLMFQCFKDFSHIPKEVEEQEISVK